MTLEFCDSGGIAVSPAWRAVSDALIAGLCHELNGRVSALGGIVHIGRLDGELDESLIQMLHAELASLEDLSRFLRMLPDDGAAGPEPVDLEERLPLVAALFSRHNRLGHLPLRLAAQAGTRPVLVRWACFCKALLVLLEVVARRAAAGGGRVVLGCEPGEKGALVRLFIEPDELAEAEPFGGAEVLARGPAPDAENAARAMLRAAGGELLEDGDGFGLSLPGLAARSA